jgi:hypothetical protein
MKYTYHVPRTVQYSGKQENLFPVGSHNLVKRIDILKNYE